jgi:hypothetical protein
MMRAAAAGRVVWRTSALVVIAAPLLLFGRSTTKGAADRINQEPVGQNVDSFLSHGIPSQKHDGQC